MDTDARKERLLDLFRSYDHDPRFRYLKHEHGPKAVVPGRGSLNPRVIMVGEAPGEHEQRHRKPFKGPAGEYLDELLRLIGLTRHDIWLTNVVKFRPTIGTHSVRNRPPSTAEQLASWPYLYDEVNTFPEDVPLVTLGKVALDAFCYDPYAKVSSWHGRRFTGHSGRPCFAWYHPAFALYDSSQRPVMEADALLFQKEVLS
jgi:uracil-DNA glycosylase family 4